MTPAGIGTFSSAGFENKKMADNLPVPKWFNPKDILEQVIDGKSTQDIALALGTTRDRLVYYLTTRAPDDWREAQLLRALRRKEEAEDAIDNSTDLLQLHRAREKLKSAQWDLERVCRRIYGDVKEPQNNNPVIININLRPGRETRVIEPA